MPSNKGGATARRLGERGPFEVDSFHAPSIGIMLNAEKFGGSVPPSLPVPLPMPSKVIRGQLCGDTRAPGSTFTGTRGHTHRVVSGAAPSRPSIHHCITVSRHVTVSLYHTTPLYHWTVLGIRAPVSRSNKGRERIRVGQVSRGDIAT